MKRIFLAMALCVLAVSASALEADFSAAYMSKYVFRGERLLDNACVTPKFALTANNFELSAMTIYDSKKEEAYRHVYELVFKTQVKKVGLDVGFLRYDPKKGNDTNEFFAKATWKGNWQPSLAVFFDFQEGSGKYIQAGLARAITSGKNQTLFGINIGYVMNNEYMGVTKNKDSFAGLYNAEIYLKSSVEAGKYITVEPFIAYSMPLSNDGKEAIRSLSINQAAHNFYGGIALHTAF